MDDTEELDWGDDEHPLIVDTDDRDDERDDDIDDDRADAVSLDDGSDDLPDYASFQLAHKNPIAVASPPTRHSATTKSPGLPPKPVASEKAPYLPSSHPSLTEASAMSSTFKRGDLPQHWELRRSRGGGDTYYYNTKTHESTWSKPASPKAGRRPASPLSSLPPRPAPYRSAPDSKPDRKARSRERRGMDSYRPQYSPSPERRPRDRPHPSLPSPPPRSLRRSPASTALPHTTSTSSIHRPSYHFSLPRMLLKIHMLTWASYPRDITFPKVSLYRQLTYPLLSIQGSALLRQDQPVVPSLLHLG